MRMTYLDPEAQGLYFETFPIFLYFWNRTSKTLTDIKSMHETDSSFRSWIYMSPLQIIKEEGWSSQIYF